MCILIESCRLFTTVLNILSAYGRLMKRVNNTTPSELICTRRKKTIKGVFINNMVWISTVNKVFKSKKQFMVITFLRQWECISNSQLDITISLWRSIPYFSKFHCIKNFVSWNYVNSRMWSSKPFQTGF